MFKTENIVGDQKIVTTHMDNGMVLIETYKLVDEYCALISVDFKREVDAND